MSSRYKFRSRERKTNYDLSYIEESCSDDNAPAMDTPTEPERKAASKVSKSPANKVTSDSSARRPAGKTIFPLADGKVGTWTPSSQPAGDSAGSDLTVKPATRDKRPTRRPAGKAIFPLAGGKVGTWTPPANVDDELELDVDAGMQDEDSTVMQNPDEAGPRSKSASCKLVSLLGYE